MLNESELKGDAMENYEFTDRYEALGIPPPDLTTMCTGQCEGVGVYPTKRPQVPVAALRYDDVTLTASEVEEARLWDEVHANSKHEDGPCDGWHFIRCSDCNGTGKKHP